MKIAYLCSDFDVPFWGHEGCSIHVREFGKALSEIGHEVLFFCASLGTDRAASDWPLRVYPFQPRGLEVCVSEWLEREPAVQDAKLGRDLRSVFYNSWLQGEVATKFDRERPELLYERYSLFGFAGVELSRKHDIPLVLEVNAPLCREQAGYEHFTLVGLAENLEAQIFGRADAIIAVSQWLKDWIVSRGVPEDKIHVIPNAVTDSLFEPARGRDELRAKLGLQGKNVIGYLGSFQPWHDVEGLLAAHGRLRERHADLHVLLIGDGEGRKRLQTNLRERGQSEHVTFTGPVAHEQVPRYLSALDVAVVPYAANADFYFSPLKLFECMAVGVPTVAAAAGQIPQIVEHGKTGLLYSPGNQTELIESVGRLLDDRVLAASLGRAAREKVLKDHTWKATAAKVIQLGRHLVEVRKRRKHS